MLLKLQSGEWLWENHHLEDLFLVHIETSDVHNIRKNEKQLEHVVYPNWDKYDKLARKPHIVVHNHPGGNLDHSIPDWKWLSVLHSSWPYNCMASVIVSHPWKRANLYKITRRGIKFWSTITVEEVYADSEIYFEKYDDAARLEICRTFHLDTLM